MKITFVMATLDMSGGARVVEIYARRLHARGHDVTIVVPELNPESRWQRLKRLLGGGSSRIRSRSPSHMDDSPVPVILARGKDHVGDDDVPDGDVIIATWWQTAQWIRGFPARKGRKYHFIQHYETFAVSTPEEVDRVWQLPIRKIVISDWLERLARDRFGFADTIKVYNSVDMAQFFAPERALQNPPTVGLLYHISRWKGTPEGLAAFEQLRRDIPDLRLLTFGAHRPGDDLAAIPGAEHVLLPPQDKIRDIYAQCDVWLCSSFGEGFHLPPLEAMACRCPVVSTRVGGPEDIVIEGVNGYLAEVGDVDGLVAGLRQVLCGGGEHWRSLSDAALAVAEYYTWDDATDLFEQAISH